MKTFLKSKATPLVITKASLECEGSIRVCPDIMSAMDLQPYQQVFVNNITTGRREMTYVIEGDAGKCEINGALAHLFSRFEEIHLLSFEIIDLKNIDSFAEFEHKPIIVHCSFDESEDKNIIEKITIK